MTFLKVLMTGVLILVFLDSYAGGQATKARMILKGKTPAPNEASAIVLFVFYCITVYLVWR